MTTPHDTPETDALARRLNDESDGWVHNGAVLIPQPMYSYMLGQAVKLERERDALRAKLAGVIERCAKVCDGPYKLTLAEAAAAIRALAEPAEPVAPSEDAQDAARYRWLRSNWFSFGVMRDIRSGIGKHIHAIANAGDVETLDAAIDAARGKQERGQT